MSKNGVSRIAHQHSEVRSSFVQRVEQPLGKEKLRVNRGIEYPGETRFREIPCSGDYFRRTTA